MTQAQDEHWMSRALQLAEKGRGFTSPNPVVGACLVKKNKLIADGFHASFGGSHAEVEAIRKAGKKTKGATLYVTLEPCSTYGKTPPCTEAIRETKIARVVAAAIDPNPKHRGRGISILKRYGLRVTTGVLKREAELQNEAFSRWIQTGVPFVILKMAQSLDGKIASRTGESRWISGPEARNWVHKLRASCDAVLVGKNTVLVDNPRLTVRNGNGRLLTFPSPLTREKGSRGFSLSLWERVRVRGEREPWRIILDERGSSSLKARIFRAQGPIILACSQGFFKPVSKKFCNTKTTILPLKSNQGKLDLKQLLRSLGALGITSLLVEGGGEVAGSFLESGLVDKICWIVAPKIVGGREAKTSVEGLGVASLAQAHMIQRSRVVLLGDDLLFEGYLHSHVFWNH